MKKYTFLTILILLVFVSFVSAETVRVVYKPDGSVVVLHAAPKSQRPGENEAQWLDRVFDRMMRVSGLAGLLYDDINSSDLPGRADRNAWEGSQGKPVKINTKKANELRQKKESKIKIESKIRDSAIEALKASGDLPYDYTE